MNAQSAIKVLLMDEDERFASSTANALERRGFVVSTASRPEEAGPMLEDGSIGLVVISGASERVVSSLRLVRPSGPRARFAVMADDPLLCLSLGAMREGALDVLERPCGIDRLERRLKTLHGLASETSSEPRARDIMVPLYSFSTIREDRDVSEAVQTILQSFNRLMGSQTRQESVHRSVLVTDKNGEVIGILTMADLLRGLGAPFLADNGSGGEERELGGLFTVLSRDLARRPVRELMSAVPPVIEGEAGLVEAAAALIRHSVRRFLVRDRGKIAGVLREQDIFFEMAKVLKSA